MFSIKTVGTFPGEHYRVNQLYINSGTQSQRICTVVDWGFNSCACKILQGFGIYPPKGVDVDAMFDFLDEFGKDNGAYLPKEYYFMISGTQLAQPVGSAKLFHDLVNHPNVQQIDQFTNKSHESKGVNLYRYSAAKDFVFPLEA